MTTIAIQQTKTIGWINVFRDPPFYLIGVLPFGLGALLAAKSGATLNWGLLGLGSLAVILIMAMTFLVNEYFDSETDADNTTFNRFSGGSRSLPENLVPRQQVLIAAGACASLAVLVGLIIKFVYNTGPWTLPLGIAAMVVGYAYTGKPFQLIYRGLGEVFDGLTIAWLPIVVAYYLLTGVLPGIYVLLVGVPVVTSIVLAGLICEYPDYASDKASKKNNLVARLGPHRAVWLYGSLGVATIGSLIFLGVTYFLTWKLLVLFIPAILCLLLMTTMIVGLWKRPAALEKLCLGTILLNLMIIILLMLVVWL